MQQGVRDVNASEIIHSSIRKNLYKMYANDSGLALGHVLFIKGRVALFPRHFIKALKKIESGVIHFKSVYFGRCFESYVEDVLENVQTFDSPEETSGPKSSRDLAATIIPSAFMHSDITNHFCEEKSLTNVGSTEVALPIVMQASQREPHHLMIRYRRAAGAMSRIEDLPIADREGNIVRFVRNAWRYEADTEVTECGSPLIVRNKSIQPGKICGIHVAGIQGTGEGFSTPIYREDIERIVKSFPPGETINQLRTIETQPLEQGKVPDGTEFLRLGAVKQGVFQPIRTKIIPSLVHKLIRKPLTAPCALRSIKIDGVDFNPRNYRLNRLGNAPPAFSVGIAKTVGEAFSLELSNVITKHAYDFTELKAVYTFDEAVKGIDGDEYLNAVKRNTSPGYPFVTKPGFTSRKDFFGDGDQYDINTPQ